MIATCQYHMILTAFAPLLTDGYDPIRLQDVKDDMQIAREEIFGPVMQLMTFK